MYVARIISALTMTVVAAFGAAPDNVAGSVYTVTAQVTAVGSVRGIVTTQILLEPNGRYIGLFRELRTPSPLSPPQYWIPADGSWSYRKVGEASGEMIIDGRMDGLTFVSGSAGTIPSPDVFFTTLTFTLAPYEPAARLANCSSRSYVKPGGAALMGFVITKATGRVLIRAIGPTLESFGLTEVVRQPVLKVVRTGSNDVMGTNTGWSQSSGDIRTANGRAGAFPLPAASRDSALLLALPPGAYIAEVSSADSTEAGQILLELYALP